MVCVAVSLTSACSGRSTDAEAINSLDGLYRAALDEIISTDTALNTNMEYISVVFDQSIQPGDSDRQHIVEYLHQKYKVEIYKLTYKQLVKQGLYDGDKSNLKGILLQIAKPEQPDQQNKVSIDASKYRSNEGSYSSKIILEYRKNKWTVVDHIPISES